MVQKQQKHYERFPVARVERPQEPRHEQPQGPGIYENSDVPPQRFAPRNRQQPLSPDQAYPPAPQHAQPQQNNQQPLAISPQQQNYPLQQQPQYMRAPSAQPQQPQPQMQWQQGPQPDPNYRPAPEPYNPNRPVPPARVGAKKNVDEILTGSIKNRKYYKDVPPTKKDAPKAIPGED